MGTRHFRSTRARLQRRREFIALAGLGALAAGTCLAWPDAGYARAPRESRATAESPAAVADARDASHVLSGRVQDRSGCPVHGALVTAWYDRRSPVAARTDGDGRFVLALAAPARHAEATLHWRAARAAGGPGARFAAADRVATACDPEGWRGTVGIVLA